MERKNDAYLSQEAIPYSSALFDNSNRGIEYFKTVDTLLIKNLSSSCMESKLKSMLYYRNLFFFLFFLSMYWQDKIWNF